MILTKAIDMFEDLLIIQNLVEDNDTENRSKDYIDNYFFRTHFYLIMNNFEYLFSCLSIVTFLVVFLYLIEKKFILYV